MTDYILYQQFGGLGDNLQFSTLPERFHEINKTFSVSKENKVFNDEVTDLVWGRNPFVQGVKSDGVPNCGSMKKNHRPHHIRNVIEWNEWRHDLEVQNTNPKIYYTPKKIEYFSNATIFNVGSNTGFRRGFYSEDRVMAVIDKLKNKDSYFVASEHTISPLTQHYAEENLINLKDIFHLCDLMHSCKKFVCLYSGPSVLAASIRQKGVLCIFPDIDQRKEIHGCSYLFPNITYMDCNYKFLNSRPDWRF